MGRILPAAYPPVHALNYKRPGGHGGQPSCTNLKMDQRMCSLRLRSAPERGILVENHYNSRIEKFTRNPLARLAARIKGAYRCIASPYDAVP